MNAIKLKKKLEIDQVNASYKRMSIEDMMKTFEMTYLGLIYCFLKERMRVDGTGALRNASEGGGHGPSRPPP